MKKKLIKNPIPKTQKNKSNWRHLFLLDFNAVIRWLIISDVIAIGSSGLIAPIFAIFIDGYIKDGNVQTAGIAATIYLLAKSLAQIPAAKVIDFIKGEKDDFWVLFAGFIILPIVPVMYIFTHTAIQLYIIQFISGLINAAIFPAYMAIFTRHIKKDQEGIAWGAYFTSIDLAAAIAGTIGGVIALRYGFNSVFIFSAVLYFIGGLFIFLIRDHMLEAGVKHPRQIPPYPPEEGMI